MSRQQITKYAVRKIENGSEEVELFLLRSGTKNEWTLDIFKATQFHSDPFRFPEIQKIVDSRKGVIVTIQITVEIE
jgi:hypothetical protein